MRIQVEPHAEQWRSAVEALNTRMTAAGGPTFFPDPVPRWLPQAPGRAMYREYFVATDGDDVRGGYVLKHEPAIVGGRPMTLASLQGPYSEGAVDPRYSPVVFAMLRDMRERNPLLYGWGLESRASRLFPLFRVFGWHDHATPVLAWRAVGAPAPQESSGLTPVDAATLAQAADQVWPRCAAEYRAFVVRRDGATLTDLYPPANPRFERLILTGPANGSLGWAVVGVGEIPSDPRTAGLRVGVLWDFLAPVQEAARLVCGVQDYLAGRGADVVVASAAHRGWIEALRSAGFADRPEQRHLFASGPLADAMDLDRRADECFLTYADSENHLGRLGTAIFGPPGHPPG